MGDRDYCVVQVSCDVVLRPTIRGEVVNALLKKSDIETAVRTNPEKARREYYCEFTSDAGMNAIIRRGVIARNSETRAPLLYNDTGKKKFILAYDPARSRDNSVILVMEIYQNDEGQHKGRIVNCVNLLDIGKKIKSPMRTPDQIQYLKQLILDYNGDAPDYENIECVLIDAGSGGGGVNIADFLMEDWVDKKGKMHRGLIDKEYSPEEVKLYPNAIKDTMRLIQPSKYKVEMYRALIEMMDMNLIEWPNEYDGRGFITVLYEINQKTGEKTIRYLEPTENEIKKLKKDGIEIVREQYYLTTEEEVSLKQIDLMKTELVNIYRYKQSNGGDRFDLSTDVANKMHDDRAYVAAMAALLLQQLRREHLVTKKKPSSSNLIDKLPVTAGKQLNKLFG
jgi:hypothetical protein